MAKMAFPQQSSPKSDRLLDAGTPAAIPLEPILTDEFKGWLTHQKSKTKRWLKAAGFNAESGQFCLIPNDRGELQRVLVGISEVEDPWSLAALPHSLPPGAYVIDSDWKSGVLERAAIGWSLGAYTYSRYRTQKQAQAQLVLDSDCDAALVTNQVMALRLVRDLINTPAGDLMPADLAASTHSLATEFGAEVVEISGDALLTANYPAIHAVGRASCHAPQLIELTWGNTDHPCVSLVGKGVCFDSGGLDLKSSANMRLMKKDMGGAAHALGLAHMIMAARLPIHLRVLIAAVENAVAGNAFRPGDVLASRAGISIEVENTDAEGRLVLADALTDAVAEKPELLLDFATLTGAARVALGTELPAFFCNDDKLAHSLMESTQAEIDPIWRLPLHTPYRRLLNSQIADISSAGKTPYAGAITAALFLQEFVPEDTPWAHFDLMAWNLENQAGRPVGGEAMALRGIFSYLRKRFALVPD